ncbi:hypothetical protein IV417_19035 [Alphaproteobacteria bacterium KMM 3653]|uniref:Argininosuccinate lyase n=1 Tax=Harenicola maris TaxID=2841044 RepID=A0AAP2CTX4_9RHOB|nr:hypothetical protein [Harenicola maris]
MQTATKTTLALLAAAMLAACGADGAPVRPTANLAIGISPSGNVTIRPTATVQSGPVTVRTGL